MFSDLQTTNGTPVSLPVKNLTEASPSNDAVHVLSSGIYYIDNSTIINGEKNKKKNGIAVAENATAYIYIPANFTLTVYGGDGEKAGDPSVGDKGTMRVDETTTMTENGLTFTIPADVKASVTGTKGDAAEGSGAAIYVPQGANLVILGDGTLLAKGGKGGNASQGALGTDTVAWWQNFGEWGGLTPDPTTEPHGWTTDFDSYGKFQKVTGYFTGSGFAVTRVFAGLPGVGGTGGSGAGGGAAVGANGANGTVGTVGGQAPIIWWVNVPGWSTPVTPSTETTTTTTANLVGQIYISDFITIDKDTAGGAGGNKPKDGAEPSSFAANDRFEQEVGSHFNRTTGQLDASEGNTNTIYITRARAGGNGGAGSAGAVIGAGGGGGAGGLGGDSASICYTFTHPEYYSATTSMGANGADAANVPSDTRKTLSAENVPYNTVTFQDQYGKDIGTAQKYYLKTSNTIAVPNDKIAITGNETFDGWDVVTPATTLPDVFDESTNTDSAKLTQQDAVVNFDSDFTAQGIYGNVVLKAKVTNKEPRYVTVKANTDGKTYGAATPDSGTESTQITLKADDRTASGWDFDGFVVTRDDIADPDAAKITVTKDANDAYKATFTMPDADVTVKLIYTQHQYTVGVDAFTNGGIDGTAAAKETVTITAKKREGYVFDHFEVKQDNGKAVGVNMDSTDPYKGTFEMPASNVTVKAYYNKLSFAAMVRNGQMQVKGTASWVEVGQVPVDEEITLKAREPDTAAGEVFTGWRFTEDTADGAAVDVTVKTGDAAADQTIVIAMPAKNLVATATYSSTQYSVFIGDDPNPAAQAKKGETVTVTAPAKQGHRFASWQTDDLILSDVQRTTPELTFAMPAKDVHLSVLYEPLDPDAYTISIEDENGQDSGYALVNDQTVAAAKKGDKVTLVAAAKIGYEFDQWEVLACDDPDADLSTLLAEADLKKERVTFTMPGGAVTFRAHYKSIEPGEPDHSDTTTISKGEAAGIGAAAAAGAVGAGLVVWQGSELAMRIYRNKTIQIDYWPGNRIALAQLIWSRAGSPEPESDVPFADITEALDTLNDTNINAQKAARWCVEQGLLDANTNDDGTECFEPMKHVTHLRVCLTWENARKMGLFEVPEETE